MRLRGWMLAGLLLNPLGDSPSVAAYLVREFPNVDGKVIATAGTRGHALTLNGGGTARARGAKTREQLSVAGGATRELTPPATTVGQLRPARSIEFTWPTHGRNISSRFASRHRRAQPHRGVDIRENLGRPILASAAGRVTFSGYSKGYGRLVIIEHMDGIETRYAHASRLLVRKGQSVERGQEIARVGKSGNARGVHCHFEIRIDGQPVDPLAALTEVVAQEPAAGTAIVAESKPPTRFDEPRRSALNLATVTVHVDPHVSRRRTTGSDPIPVARRSTSW